MIHHKNIATANHISSRVIGVIIAFLWIASVLTTPGYSQEMKGIGKYGASFLQISPSARQVAMGDAFTGLADDVNLLRYNIGGLGYVNKPILGVNFHNWFQDTEQGAVSFAFPTLYGIFGLDFIYFNEGSIIEFDQEFNRSGLEISSNDIALTLGYGSYVKLLERNISFGGGLKIIRQNLAGQTATAVGLDLGVLLRTKYISYGLTIQNLELTKLEFIDKKDNLPETYRAGIGFYFPVIDNVRANLDFDMAWLVSQEVRAYLGSEIVISDLIALRGGYKVHDFEANRWGLGVGLIIPMDWFYNSQTRLDYSYSPLDAFDDATHRFSLVFDFGKPSAEQQLLGLTPRDEKEIAKLKEQLKKEVEAAEKARLSAEEAERRAKELEDEMMKRFRRIQEIIEASQGKLELVTPTVPKPGDSILVSMRINFDFDKADIRPDEYGTMHQVGEVLNTYPESKIHIAGHTDFIGPDDYNIRLSQRRVNSVFSFLTARENISYDRFFMPIGYGELRPVDTNTTPEGRFRNRRVDFLLYTSQNAPAVPEGSAIRSVEVVDAKTVKIICNGRVKFIDEFMDNPDRIVIDFPGVFLLDEQTTFEFNQGPFIRARLGYHPEDRFSRVVIDLRYAINYTVETEDNLIYVRML
jgi:outer membrane protein OmpA-like peptidoglycan-associated protein